MKLINWISSHLVLLSLNQENNKTQINFLKVDEFSPLICWRKVDEKWKRKEEHHHWCGAPPLYSTCCLSSVEMGLWGRKWSHSRGREERKKEKSRELTLFNNSHWFIIKINKWLRLAHRRKLEENSWERIHSPFVRII